MDDLKTIRVDSFDFGCEDFKKKLPILTFIHGEQVGRHILLADDSIMLGRSSEATIMINDNRVSRLHTRIDYDPQFKVYVVNDLGSSNGTLLNDKKITRTVLKENDKIIIGKTVLKFSFADSVDMLFQGEIDKMINIDDLTGLVVKRRFDEEFKRFVAVAHRNKTPLTMLMMDMDGVKKINDSYGHQFGAYSISETGKLIKEIISSKGLASRFGGDEFMAFLSGIPLEESKQIAEKIRDGVEKYNYEKDGIKLHPTICIGLAELVESEIAEDLLKRADAALYRAKNSGRNKVSV